MQSVPRIERLISPAALKTITVFGPLPHQHLHDWLAAFKVARDTVQANLASGAGVWQTARWLEVMLEELYPECVTKGGVLAITYVLILASSLHYACADLSSRLVGAKGSLKTFGKGSVLLSNVQLHSANTAAKAFVLLWESGAEKHRTLQGAPMPRALLLRVEFALQPNTEVRTVHQTSGEKGQWELRLINVAGQSEAHLLGRGLGLYKWTQCCESVVRAAAKAQSVRACSCL